MNETKRIGHYRVIDELGRGGMGVVYKAEDTRLGRLVALKCLSPTRISDAESLRRFAREARATCASNDPHVPTIYDIGEADGIHFISSELIAGITLREQLRQALGLARTLEVAKQILQALSAAHEHGVIHRDLKPENIMIRPDGHVKVLDFGIAAISSRSRLNEFEAGSEETLTETGNVVGTMAYMSPEQALGRTLDASSDLFSFGVVLYEMLAGEHPWKRGSAIDMLHAIIHDPTPELPSSMEHRPELQALIEKTLRKNPSERYQSADALLRDCERLGRHSAARSDAQNSLAVLPFVFLSQVEEKESLSLGFADAVITSLGNLEDFVVMPTSTILKYTGGTDPDAVSQELGVRNVLQGNIQKLGQRWRVTLQLYDADARKTVFASKLDFNLADIFDIQDQISERVAESLSAKFRSRPAKARDRYSTDPNAYDEYLQGLKDSYSDTLSIMENALQHLSRAVEQDPDFALAHAALARVLADKYRMYDSRRRMGERAEYHARRALALDADLAEGHLARAYVFWSQLRNYQGREAIAELLKAQSLQPNLDGVHGHLGLICCHYGRMGESLEAFRLARRTNPNNMWARWEGMVHLWSGGFEKAMPEAEEWIRVSPSSKYALWMRAHGLLLMGDLKTGEKCLDEAFAVAPKEPLYMSLRAILHALRGEVEPALGCVRKTCEAPVSFGHDHHTFYQLASTYSLLGETETALAWIERGIEAGFPCWKFFEVDPTLATLRALPEFRKVIEELKERSETIYGEAG